MSLLAADKKIFNHLYGAEPPWQCFFCGKPIYRKGNGNGSNLNRHHLDYQGGAIDPWGIVPAHGACHRDNHIGGTLEPSPAWVRPRDHAAELYNRACNSSIHRDPSVPTPMDRTVQRRSTTVQPKVTRIPARGWRT